MTEEVARRYQESLRLRPTMPPESLERRIKMLLDPRKRDALHRLEVVLAQRDRRPVRMGNDIW